MARVFISHASGDLYFVSLLEALLKFHYLDVWCSLSNIEPGKVFPRSIEEAITEANVLLVVASKNTVESKWVTKEITQFKTEKPSGSIVPLRLDSTDLDHIAPGLNSYQAIDLSKSMLEGCDRLFSLLGKDFLSYEDRRNVPMGRRSDNDRRVNERRKSALLVRLRRGFWKAYSENTGKGEFDELDQNIPTTERFKVVDSLTGEVKKYEYFDGVELCDPLKVLQEASYKKWEILERRGAVIAVYLVEAIAEELFARYKIEVLTDRRIDDRRHISDRRRVQSVNAGAH